MNRNFKSQSLRCCSVVEIKSKYGAEFRRFSLGRLELGRFEEFHQLILHLHQLRNSEICICYEDAQGESLPINNDDNFYKAVSSALPLLRVFIQRQDEVDHGGTSADGAVRRKKSVVTLRGDVSRRRPHVQIGMPQDFRPVSSIIDVDILPECQRRVHLYRQGSDRPLGFYIRDGTTVMVTPHGLEKVPGIFISRMVPGGLAESTGLLAVNDQVLEVNGIEVTGKSLDQVTDMMIANSYNLIITVKPVNQRNNIVRRSCASSSPGQQTEGWGSISYPGLPAIMGAYGWSIDGFESDEDSDVVLERPLKYWSFHSNASLASQSSCSRAQPRCGPPSRDRRPYSVISAASYHSQPCLKSTADSSQSSGRLNTGHGALQHHASSPAIRQSSASMQDLLYTLRTDLRHHLALPQGAMEEDGIVITL